MHDVAQRLGVSTATVSRALRGVPGVAEATRERILREAEAMYYVVSPAAATLAGGGVTGRVAVVVPRIDSWYYAMVLAGAEQVLRGHGLDTTLYCLPTTRERFEFFERLPVRRRVDALLIVNLPLDTRAQSRLSALGLPVVTVGCPPTTFASVGIDDHRAAGQSVDHLVRAGHRRIGMIHTIDPDNTTWAADQARVAGYHDQLTAAGIELDDELVAAEPWGIDGGARGMERLLSLRQAPTAVFCYSDEIALGALRTLRRSGIAVPEAMSVTAVDDHPMAELADLTTVRQPVTEQGTTAAHLLVELLDGAPPRHVELPTQLVVRHSTRPRDRPPAPQTAP